MASYISNISLRGLWQTHDVEWRLNPGVNILSGGNGSGKSTMLRAIGELFAQGYLSDGWECLARELVIGFSDGRMVSTAERFDPAPFNVHFIGNFDPSAQLPLGLIGTLSAARREQLFDLIDELLRATGKRIKRDVPHLAFVLDRVAGPIEIRHESLSSGERQIITILLTAAAFPAMTMIIDEPEISLQFAWQQRLLSDILALNPEAQLIVATHSPAIVMKGWVDCISDMEGMTVVR